MKRFAFVLLLPLMLLGCDAPPDTLAGRIQDKVVQVCSFKADYAWLVEVVTKADVTAQMVDQFANHICEKIVAARSTQSLVTPKCPYGEIIVDGEPVCIEGEPVPDDKTKEEK